MQNQILEISTDDFLSRFLPEKVEDSESQGLKMERQHTPHISPFSTIQAFKDKLDLRKQFLTCFNTNNLCPGHVLLDTKDKQVPSEYTQKRRVDACLSKADKDDSDSDDPSCKEKQPSLSWDLHTLHIEFKRSATSDVFMDASDENSGTLSSRNLRTRRQIISYAALVFKYQHRCFLFTVLVLGLEARLLRWDRAGCVVTEKFNYQTEYQTLSDFFYRFSRLTESQQGLDTTVQIATEADRRMMEDAADKRNKMKYRDYAREFFAESLKAERQWWKVPVKMLDGARYLLIGSPRFYSGRLAGRGTRGYVALDPDNLDNQRKFVWLKDAWRVDDTEIPQEGLILEKLQAAEVPNIPHLMFHGDVDEDKGRQCTLTQTLWDDAKTRKNPFQAHTHYRMVVREVGRSLESFENGQVLVIILRDCIEAHQVAYNSAKILHRDVSDGNILIVEPECESDSDYPPLAPQGILTDWELSKAVNEEENGKQHRVGTWQFMSAALLIDRYKVSMLQDDLESFFHVLLYMALRYLWHNFSPEDVAKFIDQYFDAGYHREDSIVGGNGKYTSFLCGKIAWYCTNFKVCPGREYPLNDIITKLLHWFRAHYAVNPPQIASARQAKSREIRPARRFEFPKTNANKAKSERSPDIQEANTALVQKLDTHDAFLGLLDSSLGNTSWLEDKVDDQLPPSNQHSKHHGSDEASYVTKSDTPGVAEGGDNRPLSKRPRECTEEFPNKRANTGALC